MEPFFKIKLNLFFVIFMTGMMSACAGLPKAAVQPPSASSQPFSYPAPGNQSFSESADTVVATPMPSSSGEWEQVSRIQRVLGIITDIRISDGNVQFIDLKVNQNVFPPNNPVEYDYIGQTLHLFVDEKLTAAGSFQNMLKQGSSFLINFAQFAIPPKGEVVIAAKFSYNFFFYENNGLFKDSKGQPFDLKKEKEAAEPKTVAAPKMVRKILYTLDENQFSNPISQIPYYRQGESDSLPETIFKQFNEGNQPWLSSPVIATLVNCSNLISSEDVAVLQNKAASSEKKIVIDSERIITEISKEKASAKVQMTKPGGITYDITMLAPEGTEVLFVKEIIENIPEK